MYLSLFLAILFVSRNVAEGFGTTATVGLPSRIMSRASRRQVDRRRWLKTKQHQQHTNILSGDIRQAMTLGDNDSERNESPLLSVVSLGIVWVSLATVATTGAGLPPGPFGILGALEGVSYLIMLALVGKFAYRNIAEADEADLKSGVGILAERLAIFTLALSLLVLASLVVRQGCVPNATPILITLPTFLYVMQRLGSLVSKIIGLRYLACFFCAGLLRLFLQLLLKDWR